MPYPPNEGCHTCGKPLLDPCHDTPYASGSDADTAMKEVNRKVDSMLNRNRQALGYPTKEGTKE